MRSQGWGPSPVGLVSLEEETLESFLSVYIFPFISLCTCLKERPHEDRTALYKSRKELPPKAEPCQCLDLGPSRLQNLEKTNVSCVSPIGFGILLEQLEQTKTPPEMTNLRM